MQRLIVKCETLRHWLLLGCLIATLATGLLINGTATAWDQLRQESPLSPLPEAPASAEGSGLPVIVPNEPIQERDIAPVPAGMPAALSLPLGEPLRAQTSLVLVGLVLAGLIGVVALIVIRQRRP
ncbi:MAG: hypothetical protein KF893_15050 [Caldilineaceae bacterium]|nr:hypothetical protein [Caldilineaceae bacterium]